MKVTPEIIDSVMALVAKQTTKVPELLDLLSVMVTAGDELSLPVKRNQVYIMKSFMQHRTEVAAIIDQPKENRLVPCETLQTKQTLESIFSIYNKYIIDSSTKTPT